MPLSSSCLRSVRAVLIDLSGTLHVDNNEAVAGAAQAVNKLRQAVNKDTGKGIHVKFVTNTTKESQQRLQSRLSRLGFFVSSRDIFSSLSAARRYVEDKQLRPMLLLADEAMEDFSDIPTSDPNAVLIGLAPDKFNYETMTEAFRLVQSGAAFIAVHKARYFKRPDGMALGPGCFITGLEYSTGKKATVLGKPEVEFYHSALEQLNAEVALQEEEKGKGHEIIRPEETLMIGDDVRDDVLGAQLAGFKGCLVRTGKYQHGDEDQTLPRDDEDDGKHEETVNFVYDSVVDVIEAILEEDN